MPVLTAEALFTESFLPLYPAEIAADLPRARREDANPAGNPHILAHLRDAAERFAVLAPPLLGEDLVLDFGFDSVHHLAPRLTRALRDRLRADDGELFAQFVIHASAYVGEVIVRHGGGQWRVRQPLWESLVFVDSRAGEAELSPFFWLLRSLSDDEIERAPLADRLRQYVEGPLSDPRELPQIAPPDRRLPKLAKSVRYDNLYKHLKAHLPELRDLGQDFPSPERFAAYNFRSLSFTLGEGGRVLLMHGPGEGGLHLFWLSARGFEKSMFLPCSATPAPEVHVAQAETRHGHTDTLRIDFHHEGRALQHEQLLWGA